MTSSASVANTTDNAGGVSIATVLFMVVQLGLAAAVIAVYGIEGRPFLHVFLLAIGGFVVSQATPVAQRLPLFVVLSLVGAFIVFNPADATWLIVAGLTLIGLCHLPVPWAVRIAVIVIAAAGLALGRGQRINVPWSAAVWPILGSMFMFRLVLYIYHIRQGKTPISVWGSLAYFFMLPNLIFPLFPVVDYQIFVNTHFDKQPTLIYRQGLLWISRGLLQLVLYRFVYYNVLNDPVDVVWLSDVLQFMLGTFLLYLRVSGQFHLIVGILHLFGFRLPETHKLYYLAHSFTELWRRINIYWTEFMMKVVFYPVYFKVKAAGPRMALLTATSAVFLTTWLLHSYQWFWLRGGFPLTLQDTLFWGVLGALVIKGALQELQAKKAPRNNSAWNWRAGVNAASTFAIFCVLWSLWSTDSVSEWAWTMVAASNIDLKGVLMIAATLALIGVLGARNWNVQDRSASSMTSWLTHETTRTVVPLVLLLVVAQPAIHGFLPADIEKRLDSLRRSGLNARDSALNNRGYYEQLDVRGNLNDRVIEAQRERNAHWEPLASTGMLHERRTDMLTRDLYPSKHVIWNGKPFTTNQFGMRDREYTREKPPGTFRIAIVGPSLVMGSGVADGETFEAIVESRLNEEFRDRPHSRFEILNFGVEGHAMPEQIAMLEDRVFGFQPDMVIAVLYHPTRWWTEQYVRKVVWDRLEVPHPELRATLARVGLDNQDGEISVPFTIGRQMARAAGYKPRMPTAESRVRIRWVTDEFVDWAILRFATVSAEHNVKPVLLALNAVIDDEPSELPHAAALRESGLPIIDLFNIYPPEQREALRVASWDEHPNATGHRLIADRFEKELKQYLLPSSQSAGR